MGEPKQHKRAKADRLVAAVQVPRGLLAAYKGTIAAFRSGKFKRKYGEYFMIMNGLTLGLFVVLAVLYIPWRMTLWVGSFLFTIPAADMGFLEGLLNLMVQCWVIIPMVGLSFFRFASGTIFAYSEVVYFTVLGDLSPYIHEQQRHAKPVGAMTAWKIYAGRTFRLLGLSMLLFIAYNLPYVGHLVVAPAQLYMISKTFGWRPAVFMGCCYGITALAGEGVNTLAMLAFQFWMSSVALTRELLEPFFARLPDYRTQPAILRKRYYRLMFGFGLPFALLLSIPFVGPMVWGVAQAAAAALVVELAEQEQEHSIRKGTPPITVLPFPRG